MSKYKFADALEKFLKQAYISDGDKKDLEGALDDYIEHHLVAFRQEVKKEIQLAKIANKRSE